MGGRVLTLNWLSRKCSTFLRKISHNLIKKVIFRENCDPVQFSRLLRSRPPFFQGGTILNLLNLCNYSGESLIVPVIKIFAYLSGGFVYRSFRNAPNLPLPENFSAVESNKKKILYYTLEVSAASETVFGSGFFGFLRRVVLLTDRSTMTIIDGLAFSFSPSAALESRSFTVKYSKPIFVEVVWKGDRTCLLLELPSRSVEINLHAFNRNVFL